MFSLSTIAEKAFIAAGAKPAVRRYAAAQNSRLVGDWRGTNLSANQEIKDDLKMLRGRSRQLSRDDDTFIGFLRKMETYVIGRDGLTLQVNATTTEGKGRDALNDKVEAAWKEWSRKQNCDVTGQMSFRDIAALAVKTLITDGEILIRKHYTPEGLKLQMLDVDWLAEDYNDPKLPNGNRVVMSVELDRFDKPVAYHFREPRWSAASTFGINPIIPTGENTLRIPAAEIIHRFIKERAGQVRGVPWAHGAMMSLNQLHGLDEAELVGQRVGASNMVFVSPAADVNGGETSEDPLNTEVSPGQVLELPAGYTVHETKFPKPLDSAFSKRVMRRIAGSLGIDYSDLANDLESVNFSSIRAGTINARDGYRVLQTWVRDNLYQDVYASWLMMWNGVTTKQMEAVMYPIWRPRGYEWVDPAKDVKSDIDAINMGLKTRTDVLGERGQDFEETMKQIAAEKKLIEGLGLEFSSDGKPFEEDTGDEGQVTGKAKKAGSGE